MSHENYIINPLNDRMIRKGLTLHRKLIKEGVIVHDFEKDDNILCVLLKENMDVGSLKEMNVDINTLEEVCIANSKNKYDVKPNQKGKNKYYIEL